MKSAKAPVIALLYSAAFWGAAWYPLRLLQQSGLPGVWLTLFSYALSLPLLLMFTPPTWRDLTPNRHWLLLLAVSAGWANLAFILAMLDGNVVRVLLLFYLSPLWAVALAFLLLGERPRPAMLALVALALIGVLLMLWRPGDGESFHLARVDGLALSAGLAFALNNVIIRRLSTVNLGTKLLASWIGVPVAAMYGVVLLGEPWPVAPLSVYVGAALLGMVGFYSAAVTLYYGLARMPVQRSAVLLLFELVVGAVTAAGLTGEWPAPREFMGGALIVLAGYLAVRWGEGR